jgi:2-polyprenyl-6-methoxyphenol hydroxylase-like FAD-dependent oxidoreductase
MTLPSHTGVLVAGGGPTGLLTTYIFLLGGHKVITLDRLRGYHARSVLTHLFSIRAVRPTA